MKRRLLFGSLLVAALAGVYYADTHLLPRPIVARVCLWLFAIGGLFETLSIGAKKVQTHPGLRWFGAVAVIAIVVPYLISGGAVPGVLLVLLAVAAASIRLLGMAPLRSSAGAFPEAVLLAAALLYVPGLLGFLDRILVQSGPGVAFAFLFVSKSTDMAGYLVGSTIGRKRIAPALSPKKTWEGTIAGVLAAAGVAVLLAPEINAGLEVAMPPWYAAVCGLLIGAASFLGDLVESGYKRWAGVKDSATLVPEFGGCLDMLDGILLSAPVAVVLFYGQ